jgi:hypothetical protein
MARTRPQFVPLGIDDEIGYIQQQDIMGSYANGRGR